MRPRTRHPLSWTNRSHFVARVPEPHTSGVEWGPVERGRCGARLTLDEELRARGKFMTECSDRREQIWTAATPDRSICVPG